MSATFTGVIEICPFLTELDNFKHHELLSFLGTVFFYMQNGIVNSENKANAHEVSDDGEIFHPADLVIDSL